MKLQSALIVNFRRLDSVEVHFEDDQTIFVGPNNSGKTSATTAFRCFLGRRDFKVHDFPLKLLDQIDRYDPEKFDAGNSQTHLPVMRLDLWFSIDVKNVEYSKVAPLISELDEDVANVGIGMTFAAPDPSGLWKEYTKTFPVEDGKSRPTLGQFLATEGNLRKHFVVSYHALKRRDAEVERIALAPNEGKKTVRSLIRVDFVDAQRNVQDDEETSRGSKLSAAFAAFYKANLQKAEAGVEAIKIIEENNTRLTAHYRGSFGGLMGILQKLGVPSANERELQIRSIQSAEEALRGTTDLFYIEKDKTQALPEAYNGLGFKNLVLMAIQMRDFQMQWIATKEDRPLCHLVFVEEPEVHLHAQVQQTFIANMWAILNELSDDEGLSPQLVITTHSSHVLNSVEFEKVRYFRRCRRQDECAQESPLLSISEVHNLRDFQAKSVNAGGAQMSAEEALNFLRKYMTLTHCDLMFADAAILIEGTAERLLLPAMIRKSAKGLERVYLTTLEVGGAYAHVFADLMAFLHIPYLVITDIDSVIASKEEGKKKSNKACCACEQGAVTSNAALKAFFAPKIQIEEFSKLERAEKTQLDGNRFVAFQMPVSVSYKGTAVTLHGRTLEEAFIYENIGECQAGRALAGVDIPEEAGEINKNIFELVRSSTFGKTEFALGIISKEEWKTPSYIEEGLDWLSERLGVKDKVPENNGA